MTLDLNAEFLKPRQANHQALTPISFLIRAAEVFPEKIAVVYGDIRITWRDYALRCAAGGSPRR